MVHSAQGHITVRRRPKDGDNSSSYWLVVSDSTIRLKEDGTYYPSEVSCVRMKQVGKSNPQESSEGTLYYQYDNEAEQVYSKAVPVRKGCESIRFNWKIGTNKICTVTVPVVSGDPFMVDADDESIPVAVVNAGRAFGQVQKVTINAFIGKNTIPYSELSYTIVCSNNNLFTATRDKNVITITVISGQSWIDIKKETVSVTVTSSKYGSRTVTISLYPTFPGKDSCIYSLYSSKSSLAFGRDSKNNIVGTETVEFQIRKHEGTSTSFVPYNPASNALRFYTSFDEQTYEPINASPAVRQVTGSQAAKYRYLYVELWEGDRSTGQIMDRESIPLLVDGEKGGKGDKGDAGTSVTILSPSYKTLDELLKAHPKGNLGDGYLVDGYLYVWNGEAWVNVGKIQGPAGDSTYIHLAYANSADGKKDFSTTDSLNKSYIGMFASHEENVGIQWRKEYVWVFVKGQAGQDGNSVLDVTNFYKKSIDGTHAPVIDSSWEKAAPPLDSTYRFLWNFERTTYSQQKPKDTAARVIAYYSEDGRGIAYITEEYGLSHYETKQPDEWHPVSAMPRMDAYWKYLWNRETITYTDGDNTPVAAHIVGVYGDTGDKGDKGDDGLVANPNLLNATSFRAVGKHDDKWNVRITSDWRDKYEQDVKFGYATFDDRDGGLFNTKYMYAKVYNGVEDNYVDLLQQCIIYNANNRKVRKGVWYTLSFFSKGEIDVYFYSTERPQERVINANAYVDGKNVSLAADGHITFSEKNSTEWKKHTITFQTSYIDFTSHILFRLFTYPSLFPASPEDWLECSLCCIKLEEGDIATPWCRSERDMRGSRPEYPIWQEGKFYYMGEDGEDVFTICEFGSDENGDPRYFKCTRTLDVPSKLNENDPDTSLKNDLKIWEAANMNDFLLAGRIAAHRIDTKNLVTHRFYSISDDNSRSVKIENGIMEFFGRGVHSNIRLGLDENGCAMLEFYDKDGVFQYGLGPSQLGTTTNRQSHWSLVKMKFLGKNLSEVVKKGEWKVQSIIGSKYYDYTSAIITNVNQDPANDGCTFESNTTNSKKLNGIYTIEGPCMPAYKDANGRYELPNKHPDNNPTLYGDMYMRTLLTYNAGKIVGRQPVYWSSSELSGGDTVLPTPPRNV